MLEYWNIGKIKKHQNIRRSTQQQDICKVLQIQGARLPSTIIPFFQYSIIPFGRADEDH